MYESVVCYACSAGHMDTRSLPAKGGFPAAPAEIRCRFCSSPKKGEFKMRKTGVRRARASVKRVAGLDGYIEA
jgi:hypothetical protein